MKSINLLSTILGHYLLLRVIRTYRYDREVALRLLDRMEEGLNELRWQSYIKRLD